MLTLAQAQAARRRYSCVTCGHALTSAQAFYSPTGQHAGGAYFCENDAPADAYPVEPSAHAIAHTMTRGGG